jgi:hypothetical protein
MQLHYLDFDFSDEDSGRGTFDAMAAVDASRLPLLQAEVEAVLRWAEAAWGRAGALGDEGDWDFALAGVLEPDTPLAVGYDEHRHEVSLPFVPSGSLVTLTLTLSGSPAFCQALRDAFEIGG